jgi:hypothetical protein
MQLWWELQLYSWGKIQRPQDPLRWHGESNFRAARELQEIYSYSLKLNRLLVQAASISASYSLSLRVQFNFGTSHCLIATLFIVCDCLISVLADDRTPPLWAELYIWAAATLYPAAINSLASYSNRSQHKPYLIVIWKQPYPPTAAAKDQRVAAATASPDQSNEALTHLLINLNNGTSKFCFCLSSP